jgi:hypothetical protein
MSEEARREFLLAALRAATARVRLIDNELTMIGVSLKHNMIDNEGVIKWLHSEGLMFLMPQLGPAGTNGASTDTSAENAAPS